MRHLTKTLVGIGASPEGHREIEAGEVMRRLVEGDVVMQKIQRELKKKDRVIAEKEKVLTEKNVTIHGYNEIKRFLVETHGVRLYVVFTLK